MGYYGVFYNAFVGNDLINIRSMNVGNVGFEFL